MADTNACLFVIAAPSGAGKTSLVKALVERSDDIEVAVSHTTREKRPDEQDGVNYHFVTLPKFKEIEQRDGFIEYAQVFGNLYGSSLEAVTQFIEAGINLVLEIDWQGAKQIRQRMPASVSIFILPPSLQSLRNRLLDRAQDDSETIEKRMDQAISEMSHFEEFDYLVVNDDFDRACDQIRSITREEAPELTLIRQKQNLAPLLAELLPSKQL